jgi:hypothetical protein
MSQTCPARQIDRQKGGESVSKLIRNAIQCTHCGDEIESKHRHDFNFCSCGTVAVDGGLDYIRRLAKNSAESDYIELSEWKDAEDMAVPSDDPAENSADEE